MGCPSVVVIGDNLVFSVCTHNPDTGVLTDADSNPSYRVYEDETATAILTGALAKLDDANTTGFYTELIACTTGNGFEDGKTYTVYVEATVNSAKGGISYGFKATAAGTAFPAGAVNFTYTVTDDVTFLPIEGVEVWFSTNVGGTNIVWKGDTDAFGVARDVNGNLPALDVGTYYIFRQKAGYTFVDPDIEVVS